MRPKEKVSKKFDVVIIGAGAVGLTASINLAQAGFSVGLIERGTLNDVMPDVLEDGHTTALMSGSLKPLREIGALSLIEKFTQPMDVLRIMSEKGGKLVPADFKAGELGKKSFGLNVPQTPLRAALTQIATKTDGLEIFEQARVTNFTARDPEAFIEVEQEGEVFSVSAKLVIAADGRRSSMREMAGIDIDERIYGQKALTFMVEHTKPHENISTEIHKKGGPLTFVPLQNNCSAVVWVHLEDEADNLLKLKKQELEAKLQDQSNGILGHLSVKTSVRSWPLSSLKAKALYAQRLVLIGETAHAFSPVGAQGLNLSLRDVEVLTSTLLKAAKLGQDMGSDVILESYAQSRYRDMNGRFYGVDFLNKLIRRDSPLEKDMRGLGLDVVSNIAPLKHYLMREGMSPQIDKEAI